MIKVRARPSVEKSSGALRAGVWVGNLEGNSDVLRSSHVWEGDRPGGVARDREIQGQKHADTFSRPWGPHKECKGRLIWKQVFFFEKPRGEIEVSAW